MMNNHFHSRTGFTLMLSATIGDPATFLKTVGAENARFHKMESQFDFSNSPIYLYPDKKMSMTHKEKNMPWAINKVNNILDSKKGVSGIIHSGSYDIARKIFDGLSVENKKRVLIYQGSQEKEEVLVKFLENSGLVLLGPSLIEGLDLKNDKSRFQIFLKVPYPSLGDKFVCAKMDYDPEWYSWFTSIAIIQGTGRSIRNETDWCETYMIDGCFTDIFRHSRKHFPTEFQKRIQLVRE